MNSLSGVVVRGLILAAVVTSLSSWLQSAELASSIKDKGAVRCDSSGTNLESQFEKASNVFLDAIIAGQPDVILGLWPKDGVTQGIDGPDVTSREVRRDFDRKVGMFCLMFD